MSSPYGHSDKVWAQISDPTTICARLRGDYAVRVNDGAGPLNGSMTFSRPFQVVPIQVAAADLIEAQAAEIERLREALKTIADDCEVADYPPSHGAIKYYARAALQPKEGMPDVSS